MNTDFILLKAQFEAMRNSFLSLLPTAFNHDKEQKDKVWLAKFYLWRFERENLVPYCSLTGQSSPETERIDRRRFQLQVLMDVAYIQGHLEGYDVLRKISASSAEFANKVFELSDGSEASLIDAIDKI